MLGVEAFGPNSGVAAPEAVGAGYAGAGDSDGTEGAVDAVSAGAGSDSNADEVGLPISARVSVSFVVTLSKMSRFWSAFGSY